MGCAFFPFAFVMATESHQEAEADLGFRHPRVLPANSAPSAPAPERMRALVETADRFKTLRISLVIALSAMGGLICSIVLFNTVEPASRIVRWRRASGLPAAQLSPSPAELPANNSAPPPNKTGTPQPAATTPVPQVLPPLSLSPAPAPELFSLSDPDYLRANSNLNGGLPTGSLTPGDPSVSHSASTASALQPSGKTAHKTSKTTHRRSLAAHRRRTHSRKPSLSNWWKQLFPAHPKKAVARTAVRPSHHRTSPSLNYATERAVPSTRSIRDISTRRVPAPRPTASVALDRCRSCSTPR